MSERTKFNASKTSGLAGPSSGAELNCLAHPACDASEINPGIGLYRGFSSDVTSRNDIAIVVPDVLHRLHLHFQDNRSS